MKNAKNTPKPLRRIEYSESKLKRLVGIAKILYIGLKKKGANIENIDCAKSKLRCRQTTIIAERGGKSPAKELKMNKKTKQEQIEEVRKETAKEILSSLRRFLIERFDYFGMLAKRNEEVNSDNRIFDLGEQDMANCTLDRVNELLEKYGVEVEE